MEFAMHNRSWRKLCRPHRSLATLSIALGLAAASATVQAEQGRVVLGIQYGYAYLPVTVADKLGLFVQQAKAHGQPEASFEIKRISGAPAINDALISGNVDIGGYGLSGTLIAWEKTRRSLDVRALCALVAGDNGLFVNDPAIKSLADFKDDDKIAVSSPSGQQALLLQMVAERQFGAFGTVGGIAQHLLGLPVGQPDPAHGWAQLRVARPAPGHAHPYPCCGAIDPGWPEDRLGVRLAYLDCRRTGVRRLG